MEQHNIKPATGEKHKKKRVGRGLGSGHGTFSGRGCKGDKSRSGGGARLGYEGGQLPLIQRLPRKRGFTNIFKTEYSLVNISDLSRFEANAEIMPETLYKAGLIKSLRKPVKVLGNGEIDRPLSIKASKFSTSAKTKIEAAGGKTEAI
jgi:large subunit ribosomal protein L15